MIETDCAPSFLKAVVDHWTNCELSVSLDTIKMLQEKAGLSDILVAGAYEPERWAKMGDACFLETLPGQPHVFRRFFQAQ